MVNAFFDKVILHFDGTEGPTKGVTLYWHYEDTPAVILANYSDGQAHNEFWLVADGGGGAPSPVFFEVP